MLGSPAPGPWFKQHPSLTSLPLFPITQHCHSHPNSAAISDGWSWARNTMPSLLNCRRSQDEPVATTGPLRSRTGPQNSPTRCPGSGILRGCPNHSGCRRLCRSSRRCWTCHCCTCDESLQGSRAVSLPAHHHSLWPLQGCCGASCPGYISNFAFGHDLCPHNEGTLDHGLYTQSLGLGLTDGPALSLFYP